MKISWGGKIAVLYGGFVLMMVVLVSASMRQDFDLVSDDYYEQEIKYQEVIDAGKNQSALSNPVAVEKQKSDILISFPQEFSESIVTGSIHFYSPVQASLDKEFALELSNNKMLIAKQALKGIHYKVKIKWEADGKPYFQETSLYL